MHRSTRSARSPSRNVKSQRRRPILESLEDRRLLAGLPIQIEDLNLNTLGGVHSSLSAELGGDLLFVANEGQLGQELWKTDGTDNGTVLVKDINPGRTGGVTISVSHATMVSIGDKVFFEADDGVHGRELWKSDGTAAGTELVKDILAGNDSGEAHYLVELNGSVVFGARDGGLWKSNGTAQGTELIRSFNTLNQAGPVKLTAVGNKVFFVVHDTDVTPTSLWVTDGTTAGTSLIKEIDRLDRFVAVGDYLYFSADDGVNGSELWVSDGTTIGTQMVRNIGPGSSSGVFLGGGGVGTDGGDGFVYFTANDGVTGWELWRSDGTDAGTILVKDINPGPDSSLPRDFPRLVVFNGELFFLADDGTNGLELWTSNGTESGTTLLVDTNAGPDGISRHSTQLALVNDQLFFFDKDGSTWQLWTSNGTAPGTKAVTQTQCNQCVNPVAIGSLGNRFFFAANDEVHGSELWQSDGSELGTFLVKDINTKTGHSNPRNFAGLGGQTLFFADDGSLGLELWTTDGTVGGATLVKDINPGPGSSWGFRTVITLFNGKAYFSATDGVNGHELWVTDGTDLGTQLVADINPGPGSSRVNELTVFNNLLVFRAIDDENGHELWISDGTAVGTQLVSDINPGASGSSPLGFFPFGNELLFAATDGTTGLELWKTNGTTAGTVLVKDIRPGTIGGVANEGAGDRSRLFTVTGGEVLFLANDGAAGLELWKTDGTTAGTELLKDINPGPASVALSLQPLHEFDGKTYFAADDGTQGVELWRSDGTESGTVLVKDINPGSGSSLADYNEFPNYLDQVFFDATTLGNEFFFVARNESQGTEVWKSDGTSSGTMLVKDINPGVGDAFSYGDGNLFAYQPKLVESNGVLYFTPTEPTAGQELWRTDGTESETQLVADIVSGIAVGSLPRELTDVDGTLYFRARTSQDGTELWKLSSANSPSVNIPGGETTIQVFEENGELVVEGSTEFFRGTLGTITGIVVNGRTDSETFSVNVDNLSSAVLPEGITIRAGEGASDTDTLVVNGTQTVTNYQYTTGGPESGTIELDGLEIIFSQFEPIIDNLPVTNRTFTIGTVGGQTIQLSDDGIVGNGLSTIDDGGTGAFESLTFRAPTNALNINAGDGDDVISVSQLDDFFGAQLIVSGEDGNDTLDASGYDLPVVLSGGSGNDDLIGGTANDVLEGGDGDDSLDGGAGSDQVNSGPGQDAVAADLEDNITVDEGETFDLSGTFANVQSANIDWGDGVVEPAVVDAPTGVVSGSHAYDIEGDFAATFTVTDTDGVQVTRSAAILVTNAAANITPIAGPLDPVQIGGSINVIADFTDTGISDTHTAIWDWGDGSTTAGTVDQGLGQGTVLGAHAYAAPGIYVVTLTLTDDSDASAAATSEFVVVYDPSGGFVTGGGWIDSPAGAYTLEPTLTGKANFGFNSKYKKGANAPTGETEFRFNAAGLDFRSTSYEWLVIAGPKAMYKGDGTINGTAGFSFQISAIDGQVNGGGGVDKFRIKIKEAGGGVIYDNQSGAGDNDDPTTALGGGSIKIHKPNGNGNSLAVNSVSAEHAIGEALTQSTLDAVDLMSSYFAPGDSRVRLPAQQSMSQTRSREVPGQVQDTFWSEDDFLKSLTAFDQGAAVEKELHDVLEELGKGYVDDTTLEEVLEL